MIESHVETRKGLKVDIQNPQPDQFDIEDIAYALSNTCRFNGHCSGFLSVAEHSVLVAQRLPKQLQLAGLLHDATEAYLGDIPSPIKQFLADYKAIEKRFEEAIIRKFDLELTENDWLIPTKPNEACFDVIQLTEKKTILFVQLTIF